MQERSTVFRLQFRLVMLTESLWLFASPQYSPLCSSPQGELPANIYALFKIGVKRILATNAVGAINNDFEVGDFGSS
jgi:hypothetical protein